MFATDFHGQLADFQRVVSIYQARRDAGEDVFLLFAGDFIHGPAYTREAFPDFLGAYHEDGTLSILAQLEALMASDGRVRSLLGNHEHAHIGGPVTTKFHQEPDEVAWLEAQLTPTQRAQMHELFRTFALAAWTPAGILFTHAAPRVKEAGLQEVANVTLDGYSHFKPMDMYHVPIVGELLWPRMAEPEVAEAFLTRMTWLGNRPDMAVYGHEVCEEGYHREATNQLVVSTSFGLEDDKKMFLEIDLAQRYTTTYELRPGHELQLLWS